MQSTQQITCANYALSELGKLPCRHQDALGLVLLNPNAIYDYLSMSVCARCQPLCFRLWAKINISLLHTAMVQYIPLC